MTSPLDRDIIRSVALRILEHIEALPRPGRRNDVRRDWLAPPPLTSFQNLEPLGFGMPDDAEWWLFHPDDCPADLVWPLSAGYVGAGGAGDEESGGENAIRFGYTRAVTLKECRGYAHRFSRYMVRQDYAQDFEGVLMTASSLSAWIGGEWVDAQKRTIWEGRDAESAIPTKQVADTPRERAQPRLASALALKHRYEWAVSLGLENTPTIRFATDPTGIKDVFRIRDLPEGKDRREALMNWVGDHWRQDRRDPDMELYVRKHLRGSSAFTWRGLRGAVIPAQFDLEWRDKLIAERNAMRAAGTDRRPVPA